MRLNNKLFWRSGVMGEQYLPNDGKGRKEQIEKKKVQCHLGGTGLWIS